MNKEKIQENNFVLSSEAVKIVSEEFNVKVSSATIKNWCREYSIGKKVVGRWYIDADKLRAFLKDK